jgi:hypothetical protein
LPAFCPEHPASIEDRSLTENPICCPTGNPICLGLKDAGTEPTESTITGTGDRRALYIVVSPDPKQVSCKCAGRSSTMSAAGLRVKGKEIPTGSVVGTEYIRSLLHLAMNWI